MANVDFPYQKIGIKGRWQMRKLNDFSDGEQRTWPGQPLYRPSSEENYLIQLATAWVKVDGLDQPGMNYYLEKLPNGYSVFEQGQPGGNQVYKRLFGHPSGRFYDSIVRYQVHFLWLMSGMTGNCACVLCSKGTNRVIVRRNRLPREVDDQSMLTMQREPRELHSGEVDSSTRENSATGIAAGRARRDIKQLGAPYAQDEEGTEDVFKFFIKRLEAAKGSNKGIDDDIRETNSIDWRAEHEFDGYGTDLLPRYITQIEQQHSFVPRVGELVLWCRDFLDDHFLMLDPEKGEYKFYSFEQQCFHGFPAWRAGVVTEVPSTTLQNGLVDFPDLLDKPKKTTALNTAGFRVETFPDPNDIMDKSMSKQYRFVPLRSIRPLAHWQRILRGIPENKLHASVMNALTCMTSVSLLEKFKAVGSWPDASIHCKGVYLGSELITVGDTVRIAPQDSSSRTCADVLVIDSIRLNLIEVKPEHIVPASPLLSSQTSISLVGRAYTLDVRRHYLMPTQQEIDDGLEQIVVPPSIPLEEVKTIFRPVGSAEYGSWYQLHHPYKRYEVSYDMVLGRMYEADAVRLWTGQLQDKVRHIGGSKYKPSLDFDLSGILSARRYATDTDSRLPEATGDEILWFWADTRAEALAIGTFNGLEVGKYHDVRDKATSRSWNEQVRILNGQPVSEEVLRVTAFPEKRGRPVGSKLVNGKLIKPGDPEYETLVGEVSDSTSKLRPKANSQMAGAALVSTDEEDGETENDLEIAIDSGQGASDPELLPAAPKTPGHQRPKEMTKAEIMAGTVIESIEDNDEFTEDDSDADDWFDQQLPIARGGTEESEGGDYDPRKEARTFPGRLEKRSR